MSIFINGSRFAISTSLSAAAAISAVSNANPAVATTGSPPVNGDIVIPTSGWSDLNNLPVRASGVTGTTFNLEGFDSTSLTRFPAGEGIGSFQIAGSFVSLTDVRDMDVSGGEQQFYSYQNVEDASSQQRQDPTYKNPVQIKLTIAYLPDAAWFDTLVEADRARVPVVLRQTLPNGNVIYRYGNFTFNKEPTGKLNEHLICTASMSLISQSNRYVS